MVTLQLEVAPFIIGLALAAIGLTFLLFCKVPFGSGHGGMVGDGPQWWFERKMQREQRFTLAPLSYLFKLFGEKDGKW